MSKGDCQGISCIIRLGNTSKFQECFNHVANLTLVSPAIACHRNFDLKRGVNSNRKIVLCCSQKNDSPRLTDDQDSLCIRIEKELLNRKCIWLFCFYDCGYLLMK